MVVMVLNWLVNAPTVNCICGHWSDSVEVCELGLLLFDVVL